MTIVPTGAEGARAAAWLHRHLAIGKAVNAASPSELQIKPGLLRGGLVAVPKSSPLRLRVVSAVAGLQLRCGSLIPVERSWLARAKLALMRSNSGRSIYCCCAIFFVTICSSNNAFEVSPSYVGQKGERTNGEFEQFSITEGTLATVVRTRHLCGALRVFRSTYFRSQTALLRRILGRHPLQRTEATERAKRRIFRKAQFSQFPRSVGDAVLQKLHALRMLGNKAAHGCEMDVKIFAPY